MPFHMTWVSDKKSKDCSCRGTQGCQASPLPTLLIPLSLRHYPKQPLDVHNASWGLPAIAGYHLASNMFLGRSNKKRIRVRAGKGRDFRNRKNNMKIALQRDKEIYWLVNL